MDRSRRRLLRRSLLVLGVALAILFVAPRRSAASPILDQSQTLSVAATGCTSGGGTATCGQSFTVGLTGQLTSIDVYLRVVDGTLEAGLYTTSGAPPTLLQSSPMPAFTVPNFYTFPFSLNVSTGETLFFGITVDALGEGVSFAAANSNVYAGGAFGLFSPGGALGFGGDDAVFKTFVDTDVQSAVPEPATLSLLGLGLGGTAVRRWRQRRAS
jgi:hypothetical protein